MKLSVHSPSIIIERYGEHTAHCMQPKMYETSLVSIYFIERAGTYILILSPAQPTKKLCTYMDEYPSFGITAATLLIINENSVTFKLLPCRMPISYCSTTCDFASPAFTLSFRFCRIFFHILGQLSSISSFIKCLP